MNIETEGLKLHEKRIWIEGIEKRRDQNEISGKVLAWAIGIGISTPGLAKLEA